MKIVFDNVIFAKERQGGISNYWFELIKVHSDSSEVFFYDEKGSSENIFRRRLELKNSIPHLQLPLTLARLLPIYFPVKSGRILYHSSFYRQLLTASQVCEITTVHDFTHNRYSAKINRTLHNHLKYGAIRRANGIICISNNTFKDLHTFCKPRRGQKTAVIYNGVSNEYGRLENKERETETILKRLNLTNNFLLFVGSRTRYKNFSFALKLLEEMTDYTLAVVGSELSEKERAGINKKVLERIVVAESISNAELNVLYNYADALLYPSSYEGFGIPIVEAMKAGCPVLALNTSSVPEVAGNAGILFEYLNISLFVEAIRRLKDPGYREEKICAGFENSKKFDWFKCQKETASFYQEVYAGYD
jgi:glycosyltransferase involved in cell wall biosynthesis